MLVLVFRSMGDEDEDGNIVGLLFCNNFPRSLSFWFVFKLNLLEESTGDVCGG